MTRQEIIEKTNAFLVDEYIVATGGIDLYRSETFAEWLHVGELLVESGLAIGVDEGVELASLNHDTGHPLGEIEGHFVELRFDGHRVAGIAVARIRGTVAHQLCLCNGC